MKIVINGCYGGFGLSKTAYDKLIEWGIPVRPYVEQKLGPDGLYLPEPLNEGEVILTGPDGARARILDCPYWDTWTRSNRTHPLLVRVVEELGDAASGRFAELHVVEIPDGVEWELDEYDGIETVAECHRKWS